MNLGGIFYLDKGSTRGYYTEFGGGVDRCSKFPFGLVTCVQARRECGCFVHLSRVLSILQLIEADHKTMTTYIADRIAINPAICNGRPIVRGMRVTVQTVLEFLFAGTPREELLHQYPMLEPEDLDACQQFTDFKDRIEGVN